jgi:hypothetical protein
MPVPPAQAVIIKRPTKRAATISDEILFLLRSDVIASIPNTPNPWNPHHKANLGDPCPVAGRIDADDGAVVVTVRVTDAAFEPGVTEVGETLQVEFAGAPVQLSFTALLNDPDRGVTVNE